MSSSSLQDFHSTEGLVVERVEEEKVESFEDTSVVVPALNEERSISDVLSGIAKVLPGAETIVVTGNDKTDRTGAIALQAGALVVEQRASGYGAAIRTGILYSSREIIVIVDGDGTYPLDEIPALVAFQRAHGNETVVTGCRFHSKPMAMSTIRFAENMVASLLFLLLFWVRIKDTQTGLKVFPRSLGLQLKEEGMPFSTEIMTKAISLGYRVKELSTGIYKNRIGGYSKLTNRQAIAVILFMFKERFSFR